MGEDVISEDYNKLYGLARGILRRWYPKKSGEDIDEAAKEVKEDFRKYFEICRYSEKEISEIIDHFVKKQPSYILQSPKTLNLEKILGREFMEN